jgi:hypothetical protein
MVETMVERMVVWLVALMAVDWVDNLVVMLDLLPHTICEKTTITPDTKISCGLQNTNFKITRLNKQISLTF